MTNVDAFPLAALCLAARQLDRRIPTRALAGLGDGSRPRQAPRHVSRLAQLPHGDPDYASADAADWVVAPDDDHWFAAIRHLAQAIHAARQLEWSWVGRAVTAIELAVGAPFASATELERAVEQ